MSFCVPSWDGVTVVIYTVIAKVSPGYFFKLAAKFVFALYPEFRNYISNILHSILLI